MCYWNESYDFTPPPPSSTRVIKCVLTLDNYWAWH